MSGGPEDWRASIAEALRLTRAYADRHRAGQTLGRATSTLVLAEDGTATVGEDPDGIPLTPPEMEGEGRHHGFESNHDAYGLAVAIHAILNAGDRPGPDARGGRAIAGPRAKTLFARAFDADPTVSPRPTPSEWRDALTEVRENLEACAQSPRHLHVRGAECPWCARVEAGRPDPFGEGGQKDDAAMALILCERIIGRPNGQPEAPFEDIAKEERGRTSAAPADDRRPAADHEAAGARGPTTEDVWIGRAAAACLAAIGAAALLALDGSVRLAGLIPLAMALPARSRIPRWISGEKPQEDQGAPPEPEISDDEADAIEDEQARGYAMAMAGHKSWRDANARAGATLQSRKERAREIRRQCLGISEEAKAAPAKARDMVRRQSIARYLAGVSVLDAEIPEIGESARRALRDAGATSALDILRGRAEDVPGIGYGKSQSLRNWAEACRKRAPYREDGWEAAGREAAKAVTEKAAPLKEEAMAILAAMRSEKATADAERRAARAIIAGGFAMIYGARRRAQEAGYELDELALDEAQRAKCVDISKMTMAYPGWRNPRWRPNRRSGWRRRRR